VFADDNYTCQECGWKYGETVLYETFGCGLLPNWFDVYALFNRHPTFCPNIEKIGFKKIKNPRSLTYNAFGNIISGDKYPIISCDECPYFCIYFCEMMPDTTLVMHHNDFDAKNNYRENLITLCKSCNGLSKYRNNGNSIEENEPFG